MAEFPRLTGLKKFMEARNEDYNAMFKKSPMSLVMLLAWKEIYIYISV